MSSLASVNGPSTIVGLPPENSTRNPCLLGLRPSPESMTPASTISWLYAIIASISSRLGSAPASVSVSAFRMIMNRILVAPSMWVRIGPTPIRRTEGRRIDTHEISTRRRSADPSTSLGMTAEAPTCLARPMRRGGRVRKRLGRVPEVQSGNVPPVPGTRYIGRTSTSVSGPANLRVIAHRQLPLEPLDHHVVSDQRVMQRRAANGALRADDGVGQRRALDLAPLPQRHVRADRRVRQH